MDNQATNTAVPEAGAVVVTDQSEIAKRAEGTTEAPKPKVPTFNPTTGVVDYGDAKYDVAGAERDTEAKRTILTNDPYAEWEMQAAAASASGLAIPEKPQDLRGPTGTQTAPMSDDEIKARLMSWAERLGAVTDMVEGILPVQLSDLLLDYLRAHDGPDFQKLNPKDRHAALVTFTRAVIGTTEFGKRSSVQTTLPLGAFAAMLRYEPSDKAGQAALSVKNFPPRARFHTLPLADDVPGVRRFCREENIVRPEVVWSSSSPGQDSIRKPNLITTFRPLNTDQVRVLWHKHFYPWSTEVAINPMGFLYMPKGTETSVQHFAQPTAKPATPSALLSPPAAPGNSGPAAGNNGPTNDPTKAAAVAGTAPNGNGAERTPQTPSNPPPLSAGMSAELLKTGGEGLKAFAEQVVNDPQKRLFVMGTIGIVTEKEFKVAGKMPPMSSIKEIMAAANLILMHAVRGGIAKMSKKDREAFAHMATDLQVELSNMFIDVSEDEKKAGEIRPEVLAGKIQLPSEAATKQ